MNTYTFRYLDGEFWKDRNKEELSGLLDSGAADGDFEVQVLYADGSGTAQRSGRGLPVKLFLQDLLRDDSALVGLFRDRLTEENAKEVKSEIFLNFFRNLMKIDGNISFLTTTKYDSIIDLSGGTITYGTYLPKEFLKSKFGEDHPRMYGVPYIGRIKDFTPDEILAYIAPYYYLDIGAWDRQPLRDNSGDMERLTLGWTRLLRLEVG